MHKYAWHLCKQLHALVLNIMCSRLSKAEQYPEGHSHYLPLPLLHTCLSGELSSWIASNSFTSTCNFPESVSEEVSEV